MKKVKVTTQYVDIEKVTDRNKKVVNMVDENADDVELNADADVDVHYHCNKCGNNFKLKMTFFTTFGQNQEIAYFFQGH